MSFSRQETFDVVARHLIKQGRQSQSASGSSYTCAYRGVDDCRCSAGALIPDDQYDPSMEGLSVENNHIQAVISGAGHAEALADNDAGNYLLWDLQGAHDAVDARGPVFQERIRSRLREIARHWDLSDVALDDGVAP